MAIAVKTGTGIDFQNLVRLFDQSPSDRISMNFDREADALYIHFKESAGDEFPIGEEIAANVIAEYEDDGQTLLGFIVMNASKRAAEH